MMTRRNLLLSFTLGAALLGVPLLPCAQEFRVRKIGVLTTLPYSSDRWEAFRAGLREQGYVEGRNLTIEWRNVEGRYERLPLLAEELVKAGVEVIVTHSITAVIAARKATTTIPIVAAAFSDPVLSGVATSLARPSGNVTGISIVTDETAFKLLEFARAMLPKVARIAVLANPDAPAQLRLMKDMEAAFSKLGIRKIEIWARSAQDIDAGFATILPARAEALIVLVEPFLAGRKDQIAQLALQRQIPTFTQSQEFPEAGCVLSYGAYLPAHFKRAAVFVDKILKGTKAGEIPIEQSMRFELVINGKTVKALGISIPQELLVRADRVIE